MSVVAAIADHSGVHFGCDTRVMMGQGIMPSENHRKVYRRGEFIMGAVGGSREAQIVEQFFGPPDRHTDILPYLLGPWMQSLCEVLPKKNDIGDAAFLVGAADQLYFVGYDHHVSRIKSYHAIGSGSQFALGSLYATDGLSASERLRLCLSAAAAFDPHVSPPFEFLSLPA